MNQVIILFMGLIFIVISLIMPMTYSLTKNLIEQAYYLHEKAKNKKNLLQIQNDIGPITLYYYFVDFLIEAFAIYAIFAFFFMLTILAERMNICFVGTIDAKCIEIFLYVLFTILFICWNFWRKWKKVKKLINGYRCKCLFSIFIMAILIIFSFIIPIAWLICRYQLELLLFILFSLVPFYFFGWIWMGWIWTPVSCLVELMELNTS